MQIGVVYPQTEFGHDPAAVRDFAQTAEGLGFSHIVAYDHVLGANPQRLGGWTGIYTHEHEFLEPFVLFTYMAAFTQRISFLPGILILPQRQTALVAKQAATLDVLSRGRLRMGIGLGWNEVEFQALGEDFHTRGRRMSEQVEVLRQLWSQPLVAFSGRWHTIPDAGLNPLPVQRPIPLWFGGTAAPALRRAARLGDGWLNSSRSQADAETLVGTVREFVAAAGRDPQSYGIEVRIRCGDGNPDDWLSQLARWKTFGVSHVAFNTLGSGFDAPPAHLQALTRFAQAAGL